MWTKAELATLYDMKAQGGSWAEISEAVNHTKAAAKQKWYYDHDKLEKGPGPIQPEPVESVAPAEFHLEVERLLRPQLDKIKPERAHWRELVHLAIDTQDATESLEPAKDIRTVRLAGEPPPIIQYTGDWHLGHKASRYVDWLHHVTMLLKVPNAYMICLGDKEENLRRFMDVQAVISQVLPPRLQAQLLIGVLEEIIGQGKLLADIGGTHDWWMDRRTSGQMILGWLHDKYRDDVAFFYNKGLLNVELYYEDGDEKTFPNLLFHKSRYRSFLNALHGAKREYQLTFPGKIVAGAHDHEPGAEMYWHYGLLESAGYNIGGWSWLIKVGPFTASEDQLRDYSAFFQPTAIFCPAAVYTRNGIVLMPTLRDAMAFRAGLVAAQDYEGKVVGELDISEEQRMALQDNLLRNR